MSLWQQEQENLMHDALTNEIVTDCIAFSEHGAARSIIDRWSKEQLAFAMGSLYTRYRIVRRACKDERATEATG